MRAPAPSSAAAYAYAADAVLEVSYGAHPRAHGICEQSRPRWCRPWEVAGDRVGRAVDEVGEYGESADAVRHHVMEDQDQGGRVVGEASDE